MINIFITGPYAVGKTSTGKELAKLLGWKFIDIDTEFEKRYGPIADYIKRKDGWLKVFRLESKYLRSISKGKRQIIATGEFANEHDPQLAWDNTNICKQRGLIISILPSQSMKETMDICHARENKRYKISKEEVERKLRYRIPLYLKRSNTVIFDKASPKSAARKIRQFLSLII